MVISLGDRTGSSFSEGKAFYFDPRSMKYGYLDVEGKDIIPPLYDAALPFIGGVAFVKYKGKAMMIAPNGEEKFILPKGTDADVESYLQYHTMFIIQVNGDSGIVNRVTGEIRETSSLLLE